QRVPEVLIEDDWWRAAVPAEPAIGEADAVCVDELRRSGRVRDYRHSGYPSCAGSAVKQVSDTELVEQGLRLKIRHPKSHHLAFLNSSKIKDYYDVVGTSDAHVDHRGNAIVFARDSVVAEAREVEDARKIGKHFVLEKRRVLRRPSPRQVVGGSDDEVGIHVL